MVVMAFRGLHLTNRRLRPLSLKIQLIVIRQLGSTVFLFILYLVNRLLLFQMQV